MAFKSGASYKKDMESAQQKMMEDNRAKGEAGFPPKKSDMKMTPVSKGHKPNGAHGRAAVRALGRTKTTGNFKKIEAAKGKGAAIAAYQNALKAHKAGK